ncbi:MAG: cyclase family protein [Solirubrobacterales bacterium]
MTEASSSQTSKEYFGNTPGISKDAVPWLHEHGVSALACDNIGVELLVPEDPEDRVPASSPGSPGA